MKLTKTQKFWIVKPIDATWDELGQALRDCAYETRQALNRTIQLAWEYNGFSQDYKKVFGDYPKSKENKKIIGYSSLHGFAYDTLKSEVTRLATSNLSQTIKNAADKFRTDTKEILRGDKSIPSYKKGQPIDIVKSSLKFSKTDDSYIMRAGLLSRAGAKDMDRKNGWFEVVIHPGQNSSKVILDRILSGEYQVNASKIKWDDKNRKWLLHLAYTFEQKPADLNPDVVMGVDMGIVFPVYMAFNKGLVRYKIQGGEIDSFRRGIERRRRGLLEQGKYCGEGRIGHGYHTRVAPIDTISNKASNFRDTVNHKYSKYIVSMALKNHASVIQMEDLQGISMDNAFLKRWTYYDLQQKIEYKAKDAGIQVVYIDPRYTSQRCHMCGHIDRENRQEQAKFKCLSCGEEFNADYNAAKNIAIPQIEEIIREELGLDVKEKKSGKKKKTA